jgi:YihY family inner membrane protein
VSTAAAVPQTAGELEGDEALETLRQVGRKRLALDAAMRFRAADGFSHSRALAFQFTLTLLPALIATIGLAAAVGQEDVTRAVERTVRDLAPGAAGDILTEALRHGGAAARSESGETALGAGLIAAILAGTTAMAQIERGANRIYGTERDRPFLRKYLNGLALALSAGVAALASLVVLVAGSTLRQQIGWGETLDTVWAVARWPVGVVLAVAAVALVFQRAPRRRQPDWSWLAVGAGVAALLWFLFMALLALYIEATDSFGATYGPLAGTIGVLLWTFASAVALFLGLAFAAQLEAVRAGVPEPRVAREEND